VSGASNDDRPPMAVAMRWVQEITSIGLEMAVPALLGRWADVHWGTEPWLVAVGAMLGFAVAMVHLLSLAKQSNRAGVGRKNRSAGSGRQTDDADRGGA
jgi:ATP synthase protein I